MLEMRPVYTAYEREEYTRPFGITLQEDKVVICARYPDKYVGMAYISLENEKGTVHLLSLVDGYNDDVDIFLLGKAMLNYFDLHGVKTVYLHKDCSVEVSLLKRLGFKQDAHNVWSVCLEGYFTGKH